MIELELRDILSPDVEPDRWEPKSPAVWVLLQLEIGVRGEVPCDTFSVMVATPEGLLEHATPDADGVLTKRGTIVLREFSWNVVRRVLSGILAQCRAENWQQAVPKLQRYFLWEFEDYIQE